MFGGWTLRGFVIICILLASPGLLYLATVPSGGRSSSGSLGDLGLRRQGPGLSPRILVLKQSSLIDQQQHSQKHKQRQLVQQIREKDNDDDMRNAAAAAAAAGAAAAPTPSKNDGISPPPPSTTPPPQPVIVAAAAGAAGAAGATVATGDIPAGRQRRRRRRRRQYTAQHVTARMDFHAGGTARPVLPPLTQCSAGTLPGPSAPGPTFVGCLATPLDSDWPTPIGKISMVASTPTTPLENVVVACEAYCDSIGTPSSSSSSVYFSLGPSPGACACLPSLPSVRAKGNMVSTCSSSENSVRRVYARGVWPPQALPMSSRVPPVVLTDAEIKAWGGKKITVFLFVSGRLGSLWLTCRLARHSALFDYEVLDMRFLTTPEEFVEALPRARPGLHVMVYNSCCAHAYTLQHWPDRSVMVVAGDESARWGFGHKNGRNWWGPHGNQGPLPSDKNRNIILPEPIGAWFKQYYSEQHRQVFGDNVHFLPLGSRTEFPDILVSQVVPATARRYVFSFMGAPTNQDRKLLRDVVLADKTLIPEGARYFHMAERWAQNPNDPRSGYVNSTEYARIMAQSVFTPCPKGNSVEQYRIYESLESGSIPVIKNGDGYLPPELLNAPVLRIKDWQEAPAAMAAAVADPEALLQRQIQLMAWYRDYMRERVDDLERTLVRKARSEAKK